MTRALLHINMLLALLDSDHVDFRRWHEWVEDNVRDGWASCAITIDLLRRACAGVRHETRCRARGPGAPGFWPCEVSLLDARIVDCTRLHGPRQVTDAYLLALAVRRAGRFVTFDRSLPLSVEQGPGRTS